MATVGWPAWVGQQQSPPITISYLQKMLQTSNLKAISTMQMHFIAAWPSQSGTKMRISIEQLRNNETTKKPMRIWFGSNKSFTLKTELLEPLFKLRTSVCTFEVWDWRAEEGTYRKMHPKTGHGLYNYSFISYAYFILCSARMNHCMHVMSSCVLNVTLNLHFIRVGVQWSGGEPIAWMFEWMSSSHFNVQFICNSNAFHNILCVSPNLYSISKLFAKPVVAECMMAGCALMSAAN